MSAANRRGTGTDHLGTISPDNMRGSEHISIVDETSESHDLEDDEFNDLEDPETEVVLKEKDRRRGRSGGPHSQSPSRAHSTGSGSGAPTSSRFRRTSLTQKPSTNLWQSRQEATVDQSVNLMDAKTTSVSEADSARGARRVRPAMTPSIRQKSMMDIFLDQDEPMGGHGSFRGSAHFGDAGQRDTGRKLRLLLYFVAAVLVITILAVTLPGFGLVHSMSTSDKDNNDKEVPVPATNPSTMALPSEEELIEEEVEVPEDARPVTEATISQLPPDVSQVPHDTALEAFRFYIIDQDVSEEAQLEIMGSPTKKALHWITQKDPAKLRIPGYHQDLTTSAVQAEYALLQRYALAVFYYTQQVASTTTNAENSGRHLQNISEDVLASRQAFDDTWLSADPICKWHGVICNEDFESVLQVTLPHHLLQGTIPREFLDGAAMPFLTHVDLTGNQIQGGLPQVTRERETAGQQLGVEPLQTQLRVLKLGQNRMTGKLNQLMGLTHLKEVDLSQNQITGSVPDSIADLKLLEEMDLSNNQLSGGLPSQLGELLKLRRLQLDGNKLTGEVPEEVCALTTADTLQSFMTDCTSGNIRCNCCTACS